jgi:uncharacterized protein DUF6221
MSDELLAFFRARLDEKEAAAWSVHDVAKCDALLYEEDLPGAAARTPDCDCGYPARVLREVEAGRKILAEFDSAIEEPSYYAGLIFAIGVCVAVFSDHPDYRTKWKPCE